MEIGFLLFYSTGQVVYAHQFVNLTGENLTDTSLFDEHLCSLLRDLTGLAIGKYSKVGGSLDFTRCMCLVCFLAVAHIITTVSRRLTEKAVCFRIRIELQRILSNRSCLLPGETYRGTEQPSLPLRLHQRVVGPAHVPSGTQE